MRLFRRRTIFHVEDTLPDPEELKLRFRRRILLLTFCGFVLVLGIPVVRGMRTNLETRVDARKFAEQLIATRTMASAKRTPVSLDFKAEEGTWRRAEHAGDGPCDGAILGTPEVWVTEGVQWKFQRQQENEATVTGKTLCLHPRQGLMLDRHPLNEGKLLVTVTGPSNPDAENLPTYLLITQGGAGLQILTQ